MKARRLHHSRIAVAGLVLSGFLALGTAAQAADIFLVVKITDMNRSVEYQVMTPEDYKTLENQIRVESGVFQKAEDLAKKEWKSDESNKGITYPASRLSIRKAEVIERDTTKDKADKKAELSNNAEGKHQPEPKKGSKKMTEADTIKAEKERNVEKACELLKSKIEELVAKEKEKAPKPEAKAKDEDAK